MKQKTYVTAHELLLSSKREPLKKAKWQSLDIPIMWIDGVMLPPGTEFKVFEGKNFGYVWLATSQIGDTETHVNSRCYKF